MKKTKLFLTASLAAMALGLVACGPSSSSVDTGTSTEPTPSTSETTVAKYRVSFANTEMPDVEVEEGDYLERPADPTKEGHRFIDWYLDAAFNNKAVFPIKVTKNLTIYARFMSYREDFLETRAKTVDGSYQYTDSLNVTTTLASAISGPSAKRTGEVQASNIGEIQSLEHYKSSGALLFDGEQYLVGRPDSHQDIRLNEDGKLTKFETIPEEKVVGSTFAKAIFEYTDEDILSVDKVGSAYRLSSKANASSIIATTLSFLDSPLVQSLIEQMPSNEASYLMEVTYNGEYLASYHYSFSVEVASVAKLDFDYRLNFTGYEDTTIVAPSFPNLDLDPAAMEATLADVTADYQVYENTSPTKDKASLALTMETETAKYVTKGTYGMKRTIQDNKIYFNNHIKVDSDLKELYPEIEDYEVNRANLLSGDVYSCVNKLFNDEFNPSTGRGRYDEYLFRIDESFFAPESFEAIERTPADKEWNFLLSNEGAKAVLEFINQSVYLQEESNEIRVLGDFVRTSLDLETKTLLAKETAGLFEYTFKLVGKMETKLSGSRAETVNLDLELTYTELQSEVYEIPETTDDIALD